MIISRTPFRVSFFGGGSDFPEYYSEHGGSTLLTTIDKYCYLTVHRLSPFFKHRFRAGYAKTENVIDPKDFQHPLIRECLLYLAVETGLEISHVSDLPGRTGLGTSSSFTVGLLHALHTIKHQTVDAERLAREAIIIERERVGDPGGHQDQYAAAYGGLVRFNFTGEQDVVTRRLAMDPTRLDLLQEHLMMFYTGIDQSGNAIADEQRKSVKKNTETLKEMVGMVDEGESILTGSGDLNEFGKLLHASWTLKRGLSEGISNDLIDQAYEAAMKAGAIGGKLLGAGGRGFLLLYAEPGTHTSIREHLSMYQEVDFKFCADGSQIIFATEESKHSA